MKRVLLIACNTLDKGGIQNVIMSIVRNLSDDYCFDIVVFDSQPKYYDEEFLEYGGRIFRLPDYEGTNKFIARAEVYFRGPKKYKKIKDIIKKYGPYDIVHSHNDFESGLVLKAANDENVPIRIAHAHVTRSYVHKSKELLNIAYKKLINMYSTQLIGCSEGACEYIFGLSTKTRVIPNSYNDSIYSFSKLKREEKRLVLTQVGYYNSNKNQLFSIKVLESLEVILGKDNVVLNFIGFDLHDGYYDAVKKEADGHSVIFHKSDANIREIFESTNYLLFPSLVEGFGIVLLEAQASGIRCCVSDSVPHDADCGGCEYLSLKSGAKHWADVIINNYYKTNGEHIEYDCHEYSESYISKEYRNIYG